MGEMTFGDTVKSSFCIKHKLLIQFKKIIFCFFFFFFVVGEEERVGWGREKWRALAFSMHLLILTENTSPLPWSHLTKLEHGVSFFGGVVFSFFYIKHTFT